MKNKNNLQYSIAAILIILLFSSCSPGKKNEQVKLFPSDKDNRNQFGTSVCVSDNHAVVGVRWDDENGKNSGAAIIYKNDSGKWKQHSKLMSSSTRAYDEGYAGSVDMFGDYIIVGAGKDDDYDNYSGCAYIYKSNNGKWEEQTKLIKPDLTSVSDYFGSSVSISGNHAIVGAFGDESAYMFCKRGMQWSFLTKLLPSDGKFQDAFGMSVCVSGKHAIVGSHNSDGDNGSKSGAAYIYYNKNGQWKQQAKLIANDGSKEDGFGVSVSISGDYAIVGADGDDVGNTHSGSAYIFKNNSGIWEQQTKLTAVDGNANDYFGNAVSISGDYAVVGAPMFYNGDKIGAGAAYVYYNRNGEWQQQNKILPTSVNEESVFGRAVCISDKQLIIGDPLDKDGIGAAYIYDIQK